MLGILLFGSASSVLAWGSRMKFISLNREISDNFHYRTFLGGFEGKSEN